MRLAVGVGYNIGCGNKATKTNLNRGDLDEIGGVARITSEITRPVSVGSGNHYVNVMEDESNAIWVGVHFGSRGFGHKTASGFLALAEGLAF
ncbi:MAG TPA: RtcB family protein, partial [Solirubrobacteraceae bacterium]|nr:RtcB family protein [Solirubrobacteraceae bacterium]